MPRTGRPTKLTSTVAVPGIGDEPERAVTCADRICELIEQHGMRAELCARDVGVDRKTVESWMAQGARAAEKHAKGELLSIMETRFRDFLLNTRAAHSRWTHRHLALLDDIAAGGLVIGKVIEKVDPTRKADGSKVAEGEPNPRPYVIERRMESAKALPDAKALQWLLERQARDDDGQRIFAPRVEVTGADGGPVEVESREARAERLASELASFQAGAEAQRALDTDRESANGQATEA